MKIQPIPDWPCNPKDENHRAMRKRGMTRTIRARRTARRTRGTPPTPIRLSRRWEPVSEGRRSPRRPRRLCSKRSASSFIDLYLKLRIRFPRRPYLWTKRISVWSSQAQGAPPSQKRTASLPATGPIAGPDIEGDNYPNLHQRIPTQVFGTRHKAEAGRRHSGQAP